jgi:hypothetical protein
LDIAAERKIGYRSSDSQDKTETTKRMKNEPSYGLTPWTRVGNNADSTLASHNWFAIYAASEVDKQKIGIVVDPWYSAGGEITPKKHLFGKEHYIYPYLW